ncbi:hypothetical protein MtrunA17_Chr8g0371441 [Medicago truncatula]|uniref:Transmembrane protein n=1 Tax=Medicago truncatula TaxID=3880 RepID=A0A396GP32_MEDTR|nr:hypothetical protein MtrunA17_Chr8g0371441 [Medicago truncatula]
MESHLHMLTIPCAIGFFCYITCWYLINFDCHDIALHFTSSSTRFLNHIA